MLPSIGRVYVNRRAREELGWKPRFDFRHVLGQLQRDEDMFSSLAREVGIKGYHSQRFEDGPYPIESGA
jgi:UDP-glucose 4-epimerase